MIIKNGLVLLGKRTGSHGKDTWSFPGGHLEFGESLFGCAKREVMEETGLEIKNLSKGPFTEDIFEKENLHYITMYVIAEYSKGTLVLREPDKCLEWKWFDMEKLPENIFLPLKNLIKDMGSLKKLIQ